MPDSTPEPTPDLRVNHSPHLPSEPLQTDHSTNSGAARNGAARNGAAGNGAARNGAARNGAAFERAVRAWNSALLETQARQNHTVLPSREWFSRLPAINRRLIGTGTACLLLGLFCLLGVPLLSATGASLKAVAYPYTEEGRRDSCLSGLQRVSVALAQYRQDYDGKFPTGEYKSSGKRVTWMAALRERGLESDAFACSAGGAGSDLQATGSYGFNPVFAGRSLEAQEVELDFVQVVLLADRSTRHDSILLPPLPGWPGKDTTDGKVSDDATEGNLDFRHGGQTAVLYVDGHADAVSRGEWTSEATTWGGPFALAESRKRLEAQHPLLVGIKSAPAKSFASQKVKLRAGLDQLRVLDEHSRRGGIGHETVSKRLWKGAGILRAVGDGSLERELTSELDQETWSLLSEVGSDWTRYESEHGFALQHPASWQVEYEADGRYHSTYVRSASPHLYALVEWGERTRPTEATTIDWTGMERSLQKQFGANYKRLSMGRSTLGGREVSSWECELKKPDGPNLHKRYLGYSTRWNSLILVTVAPVGVWNDSKGHFEKIAQNFEITN